MSRDNLPFSNDKNKLVQMMGGRAAFSRDFRVGIVPSYYFIVTNR